MRCWEAEVSYPVKGNSQASKDNDCPLWCRLPITFVTTMQIYGPNFTIHFHEIRCIQLRCFEIVIIDSNSGAANDYWIMILRRLPLCNSLSRQASKTQSWAPSYRFPTSIAFTTWISKQSQIVILRIVDHHTSPSTSTTERWFHSREFIKLR